MSNLLPYMFLLACPVGMGTMMFFMMRGMRGGHEQRTHQAETGSPAERLAHLEVQKRALAEQIALAERERAGRTSDSSPGAGQQKRSNS